MDQQVTAPDTRSELLVRLAEALASDDGLGELVEFLRDDLAYTPDNQTVIGAVLHEREFDAWRDLMSGVRWDAPWPIECNIANIRALSRRLLTEMQRA